MSKDYVSNHKARQTLPPIIRTATATGATIDRKDEKRAAFELVVGLWVDGVHTVTFEESADGSAWSTIAAAKTRMPDDAPAGVVVGATIVIDAAAEDNVNYLVGYTGQLRYLRAKITSSGTTTGALIGINVVSSDLRYSGVSEFAS